MKTYEKYFLQHKNVKVAFITVGCDGIKTVKVNPDTERYLPVGVKNESELKAWLLRRCLPDNREFLKEDLGEKKKLRYMLEHLSLVDDGLLLVKSLRLKHELEFSKSVYKQV